MGSVVQVLAFLAEHADLIEEVITAIRAGTPKDAIKAGIRAAKAQVSDAAIKEELFR